ncbi:MAG TPA: peptidylprolyl isomerase, partial [Burkholderiales bacterium]|nr:peptidylprolyl isomerase [Burkholderiales bacterium]
MNFKHLFILSAAAVVPAGGALAADPQVDVRTNLGTIRLELNAAKAPKTVENFLQYVKDGHYIGTIFHRVIDGFMIQGGGMKPDMSEKPTRPPIALEAKNGLSNARGTVAMARTSMPDSATSQFFINVVDNPNLDSYGGGYA